MQATFHRVAGELIDYTLPPLFEFAIVRGSPPALELSRAVVLRALIVEAVRNFVADHRTDTAIIDRVGGIHIEHRGQQNSSREYDLVEQRIVISVRSWRGHAPSEAVHRFANQLRVIANGKSPRLHY